MNGKKNAQRGILFGYINQIICMVCPFITRTIIIYKLGTEYVGLGGLFTSILGILSVTELGFSSAFAYVLYEPIAKNDVNRIREILGFSRKVFRWIGFIILLLGGLVTPFLDFLIKSDVPDNINVYILFLLYLFSTVISYFLSSYKRVLLNACQRYDVEVSIQAIIIIIQTLMQVCMLLITENYYWIVIAIVVCNVINNILIEWYSKKLFPQYYCYGNIQEEDKEIVKEKVKGIVAARIGTTVFNSVDNIVISFFFGLIILGQYMNYYYVQMSAVGFFAIIHNTLRPIIGNKVQLKNKEEIYSLQKSVNYIYLLLTFGCVTGLIVLYQDFIRLWIGESNMMDMGIVILCTLFFMFSRIASIPQLFTEAMGLWWEARRINIYGALLNLVINIVLCKIIGLYGVIISSIVCMIVFNFFGFVKILFKYYYKDRKKLLEYMKVVFFETIKGLIGSILIYMILQFISPSNWFIFIVKGVLAMGGYLLYVVVCELVFQKNLRRIKNAKEFIGL